jgi:hypothetical protein
MTYNPVYKNVKLLPEAKDALESLAAQLTGQNGYRLTLSETVIEAEKIVRSKVAQSAGEEVAA